MSDSLEFRKVTVLEGYYSTGDFECFCFDKRNGPYEDEREWEQQNAERVYPDTLLPRGRYGDWRITVEFTPKEKP